MKEKLDWQSKEVVDIFDEASLWAAPFGRLLLENIPMSAKAVVLDIGFGLGFPLIELSQRFGEDSKIYGVDIWEAASVRAREKIKVLSLQNIHIFEQSATHIPLDSGTIDLITSNLGVNNFEEKEQIIQECHRLLKDSGTLCITSNILGTFQELFNIFNRILNKLSLPKSEFNTYIEARGTRVSVLKLFTENGFKNVKCIEASTQMRFTNAQAVLNHSLIRIGFREGWENFIPKKSRVVFFSEVEKQIQSKINQSGEFRMSIPMLYLEFVKQ